MTSLVSPLTRVAKAGVSDADFTALESSVATNISKPTSSEIDGLVATRTKPSDVQTALNARFQAQDISNLFVVSRQVNGD